MERRKKVLCPVETKDGKTYWMRVGTGFINADGSTNLYLNAYPISGKLQIRDYDPEDLQRMHARRAAGTGMAPAAPDAMFPPREEGTSAFGL